MAAILIAPLATFPEGQSLSPTFEGFGAVTRGARSCSGFSTYRVTSLADGGAGTLRDAVSQPCRYIVFDVSGIITLTSALKVRDSYLTIDGASAPAPGITISQPTTSTSVIIEAGSTQSVHDIIVHNLRHIGPGGHSNSTADVWGLDGQANEVYNIVLDHITAQASNDGVFDLWGRVRDVTISWNLITDTVAALHLSETNTTRERISFHHNVFARNNERQIKVRHLNQDLDFVNNVVYGWGWMTAGASGLHFDTSTVAPASSYPKMNVEGNVYHYVTGLAGGPDDAIIRSVSGQVYFAGNIFPSGERDASSSSARHPIPAAAAVTQYSAATLGSTVVRCVGTMQRTATEQSLLDTISRAIGGPGGICAGTATPPSAPTNLWIIR